MNNALRMVIMVMLTVMVAGCGLSKSQIGEIVKTSMQEKLDYDPGFKNWHLSVTDVQVLAKGGNQYQGIAKIMYEGISHDVSVEITVDGDDVMWQIPPGSFMFVLQGEMEKLGNIFQ